MTDLSTTVSITVTRRKEAILVFSCWLFLYFSTSLCSFGGNALKPNQEEVHYAPRISYYISVILIDDATMYSFDGTLRCFPVSLSTRCYEPLQCSFLLMFEYDNWNDTIPVSWSRPRNAGLLFEADSKSMCVNLRRGFFGLRPFDDAILSSDYQLQRWLLGILAKQVNIRLAMENILGSTEFSADTIEGLENAEDYIALHTQVASMKPWIECRLRRDNGESHEGCTAIYDPQDYHLLISQGMFKINVASSSLRMFYHVQRLEFSNREDYLSIEPGA